MNGFVAATDKGARYLLHGMQKNASDIIKDFEAYVLGDVQGIFLTILYPTDHSNQQSTGLVMNHNGRLSELKRKIRYEICDGLGV